MNDRELLELAARAAFASGVALIHSEAGIQILQRTYPNGSEMFRVWAPLTDDGDALRLAVALNLTLRCYAGNTCAQTTVPGGPSVYIDEWNQTDPLAATRRAIVRAAAEIGKAM